VAVIEEERGARGLRKTEKYIVDQMLMGNCLEDTLLIIA